MPELYPQLDWDSGERGVGINSCALPFKVAPGVLFPLTVTRTRRRLRFGTYNNFHHKATKGVF